MQTILVFAFILNVFTSSSVPIQGPLTKDFQTWLQNNGYSQWVTEFMRSDLGNYGSYGGKATSDQLIKHTPVVFVHGNSDQALDSGKRKGLTGWTASINFFMVKLL